MKKKIRRNNIENKNKYKKNNNKNNYIKILIITEFNFDIFKILKKQIINKLKKLTPEKYFKVEYLNLNKLNNDEKLLKNKKIKYYKNIIFLSNENLLEIKNLNKIIEKFENNYFIKKEKINILFSKNQKNSFDLKILKNIFKKNNILGKINFKQKEIIDNEIINKINLIIR